MIPVPFVTVLLLICLHAAGSNAQQPMVSTNQAEHTWQTGSDVFLECHLEHSSIGDSEGFEWTGPALADSDTPRVIIERSSHLSRLRITDVRPSDRGEYQCRHSLAVNTLTITVTVKTLPTFVPGQQTEFSAFEGGDVVLPCRVRYCPSCEVFWRKDGDFLDSTSINNGHVRTESLTLTGVTSEDAGIYQCTIEKTSMDIRFTLNVLSHNERVPMLNKSFSYHEVYYTEQLMLRCPVRSGENTTSNPLDVSWVFTNIHDQLQYEMGQTLVIPASHYTRGLYKCTARNSAGEDSLEIFVEINAPPLPETGELPTVNFREGSLQETLTFPRPSSPVALHALTYRWEKFDNGIWIQLPQEDKYRVAHNGYLKIENIVLADAGIYRVNISNDFGKSVLTRRVDVSPKPTPGEPVAIGFSFELPEGVSCNQVQDSSDLLTSYLVSYLEFLCTSNTTALPEGACSDLQVQDVSVECPDSQREGTFRAMLRASSAQTVVNVFEESGPTEVEHVTIDPCGQAQCVIDPTVVTDLRNLLAVLVVVGFLLVLVMTAIAVCVACCVCKHKKCNRSRVADIESQVHMKEIQHQLAKSYGAPTHNTLGTMQMIYDVDDQRYVEVPVAAKHNLPPPDASATYV